MIASNDLDKSIQSIYLLSVAAHILFVYKLVTYIMNILRIYTSNNSHKIVYKKDKLKIKLFRSIVYKKLQFAKYST
jgi:hypothetical protein